MRFSSSLAYNLKIYFTHYLALVLSAIATVLQKNSRWTPFLLVQKAFAFPIDDTEKCNQDHRNIEACAKEAATASPIANGTLFEGTGELGVVGIGVPVSCRPFMDAVLKHSTEFDKAGSASAATIMALMPTLLAFGPLKTADIQTQFYIDIDAALVTSAMTFCMPVRRLKTIGRERILRTSDFYDDASKFLKDPQRFDATRPKKPAEKELLNHIEQKYNRELTRVDEIEIETEPKGDRNTEGGSARVDENETNSEPRGDHNTDGGPIRVDENETDPKGGSTRVDENETDPKGGSTRVDENETDPKEHRPSRLRIHFYVMSFLALQAGLLLCIGLGLFRIDSIIFVWACDQKSSFIFMWWLTGSAGLSVLRAFIYSSYRNPDEVFHISTLPENHYIFGCESRQCNESNFPMPKYDGIFSVPKPRLTSEKQTGYSNRTWRGTNSFERVGKGLKAIQSWLTHDKKHKIFLRAWKLLKLLCNGPSQPHPLILVLRPTAEFRTPVNPFIRHLVAYIELIFLLFVSMVFGSTIYGTLFYTLGFVIAFMTTMGISRLASIGLSSHLERRLDMEIIEYNSDDDHRAIKSLILNLPGCIIESRTGAYRYVSGFRQDGTCTCHVPYVSEMHETKVVCMMFASMAGLVFGTAVGAVIGWTWKLSVNDMLDLYVVWSLSGFISGCMITRRFWHIIDVTAFEEFLANRYVGNE
ncbi:hypothetical protein EDC01DRAFT_627723 [Geopyxis carbonaria]|nr:hypothetical protein EDC01DRAFT_627723 [Geopyxis carbonaria]